jgi:hypothetical protein
VIREVPRFPVSFGSIVFATVSALLLVGCQSLILRSPSATASPTFVPPSATPGVAWDTLRVAMRLPRVATGASCSPSPTRGIPGISSVLGGGPVYPWGTGVIPLDQMTPEATGHDSVKVVWVIDPARYSGPALVRGERLDDGTPLLFKLSVDGPSLAELRIAGPSQQSGTSGWPEFGSYTVLPAGAGCYGYQVDGFDVAETVIFDVR